MIKLGKLSWGYAFSYGDNNSIDFSECPLVQLVAKNGHGKTSIALILEECLYNKNSKGIKKANIINRYADVNKYWIKLEFVKDNDTYFIDTVRGTTATIKLYKNGEDISAHTATNTYKLIEDILGMDHKAFCQIVYQSSASSLEFLTATDSVRKKFLIDLLSLEKYTKAGELFKSLAKDAGDQVSRLQGAISVATQWLDQYKTYDFTKKEMLDVPTYPDDLQKEIGVLEQQIADIEQINRRIVQNNKYKEILAGIKVTNAEKPTADINKLRADKAVALNMITERKAFIAKFSKVHGDCPTCLQAVNEEKIAFMVKDKQETIDLAEESLISYNKQISDYEAALKLWQASVTSQQEWEKYHALVDASVGSEVLDRDTLVKQLAKLQIKLDAAVLNIASIEKQNKNIYAANAKIDVILSQRDDMRKTLEVESEKLRLAEKRLATLQILVKTFSTTGLVAYKIEGLVKDLEDLTNEYLADLSDGRFNISFQISSSDKLNVVITDNGVDIEILALSGGERARVNMATLLAIRALMQSLSNSRINLLFLDETVESLDSEGKEKLVEILLNEKELNTVLVSHGYQHALLEKVFVVKENNISRIE